MHWSVLIKWKAASCVSLLIDSLISVSLLIQVFINFTIKTNSNSPLNFKDSPTFRLSFFVDKIKELRAFKKTVSISWYHTAVLSILLKTQKFFNCKMLIQFIYKEGETVGNWKLEQINYSPEFFWHHWTQDLITKIPLG